MTNGMIEALQGRLSAHRRVLAWLLRELSAEQSSRLVAELTESYTPQDGQEDPGAVPVEAFAGIAAWSAELHTIVVAVAAQNDRRG